MRAALLLVGAIWGVTSPFLQCNDTHDTSPQGEHILKRTLRLLTNTKFIVPYLLNQSCPWLCRWPTAFPFCSRTSLRSASTHSSCRHSLTQSVLLAHC